METKMTPIAANVLEGHLMHQPSKRQAQSDFRAEIFGQDEPSSSNMLISWLIASLVSWAIVLLPVYALMQLF